LVSSEPRFGCFDKRFDRKGGWEYGGEIKNEKLKRKGGHCEKDIFFDAIDMVSFFVSVNHNRLFPS